MDLLNTTLGAVGQVGDAIDKYTGGRAVRGTLAGKPRELASIVPFSDTIGLTRPEDATSGRDLTDSYGLTTKGSNSFGSHAAGFVADNVLSPANWLGAGAAFKAAPTLAKGAVGAAKALTGADLLDHVAGGAKKLGSFLGGESGSLKLGSLAGRFDGNQDMARAAMVHGPQFPGGTDKLEDILRGIPKDYYKSHLRKLMGNPEAANFVASEVPEGSKYLGAGSEGMALQSPFGHVIRFQDRPGIGRVLAPQMLQPHRSVSRSGYTVEHAPLVNDHNAMNAPVSGEIQTYMRGLPEDLQDAIYGKLDALHSRRSQADYGLGEARLRTHGEIYKGNRFTASDYGSHNVGFTDEGNILAFDPGAIQPGRGMPEDEWASAWSRPVQLQKGHEGMLAPGSDAIGQIDRAGGPAMIRDSLMEAIAGGTKGQGVPAPELGKDVGGLMRTVRGLSAKGVDPAEAIRRFMSDESGALDIGAFGSKSRSGLAPKAVATTQINTAIQDAAKQFARFNPDTQFGPAQDLATRFIKPPELPSDPDQAKQLADQFTNAMTKGRDSASAYFGPTYYDINNYLRTLGPEAAQAEVQAIREGRARVPSQSAPQAAAASMDNWDDTPTLAPSKFNGVDEAELFGLVHDGADSIDTGGWDDFLKGNDSTVFGDHPGHEMPLPHPGAPAFTPDAAKLAEFDKLTGESHEHLSPSEFTSKLDAMGTQAIGKKIFGDEYGKYVDYIGKKAGFSPKSLADSVANASQSAFAPDPSKIEGLLSELGYSGTHLFGKNQWNDPSDWDGVQSAAKKIFGDQYGQYVQHIHDSNGYDNDPFGAIPIPGTTTPAKSHYSKPSPLAKSTLDPSEAFRLEGIRKHIAGLSGLIDNSALPQDMDLFRGVDGPGMRKISELIGAPLNSPEAVGREFVDPAFMSTAFSKRTADSFAGLSGGYNRPDAGVTFTFPQVPAGKPASFMNASEHEVLFPPGRKIKITDNSNYPHLKAELYGTLLAAILGRQAAQYGGQNGNP